MTDFKAWEPRQGVHIIDNFFPEDVFDELYRILLLPHFAGKFGGYIPQWQYTPNTDNATELKDLLGDDPNKNSKEDLEKANNKLKEIILNKGNDWRLFYLIHLIFAQNLGKVSPLYDKIIPPFSKLQYIKALIRVKINMYPNSETLKEHGMHTDLPFEHKAAILSINTCDGYTTLEDGTKIDSVANRILLFDASRPHSSSNTTDQPVRMNINFNWF